MVKSASLGFCETFNPSTIFRSYGVNRAGMVSGVRKQLRILELGNGLNFKAPFLILRDGVFIFHEGIFTIITEQ
jgi:hypothetical protein